MREGRRKVGRRNTRIEGGRSLLYNHLLWESYTAKKVLLCVSHRSATATMLYNTCLVCQINEELRLKDHCV